MNITKSIIIGMLIVGMIFIWPVLFAFVFVLLRLAFYVVVIGVGLWIIGEAVKYLFKGRWEEKQ